MKIIINEDMDKRTIIGKVIIGLEKEGGKKGLRCDCMDCYGTLLPCFDCIFCNDDFIELDELETSGRVIK